MNYKEALAFLDSFIDYEKLGYKNRRSFNLQRMFRLAEIFKNPEESFPSVHITGTKGKGSTASFISSILNKAGFRVGTYTSPHLVDPTERIRISGNMITEERLAFHVGEIEKKLKNEKLDFFPTFFEIYTILAFNYFRAEKIDFGVIEVGLGGRLDATNIVKPVVAVISPVSYDHTNILGENLGDIAFEKAGILKKGCICVSAPQKENVLKIIEKKCKSLNVELILIGKDITYKEIRFSEDKEHFNIRGLSGNYMNCISTLIGRHQIINALSAVGIAESLKKMGTNITGQNIKDGIAATKNPGRCELIARKPYVLLDGAQNAESARALKETIKRNFRYEKLILVLGVSKEKDIKGISGELVPLADTVILTRAKIERSEDPDVIKKFIKLKNARITGSISEAIQLSLNIADKKDLILVTGSFFVLGEAKEIELEKKRFVTA